MVSKGNHPLLAEQFWLVNCGSLPGMVYAIPTIYGDDRGMVYHCYTHIKREEDDRIFYRIL